MVFVDRIEEESEKSLSREMIYSDHLAIARAYNAWNHVLKEKGPSEAFAYARRYYISHNALFEIHKLRESFRHHLISAGLIISADKSNRNQSEALEDIDRNDDITTNMVQDVGSDAKDEDIATKDPEMHSFLMLSSLCAGMCMVLLLLSGTSRNTLIINGYQMNRIINKRSSNGSIC